MALLHGGVDAEVDPEAHEAADLPAHLVQAHEAAAHGGRRQLRDVDGRHVGAAAHAEAAQDAAAGDEAEALVARRGHLHDAPDGEDDVEEDEGPAAAEVVARAVGGDGAEEGSRLVDGDDVLLGHGEVVGLVARKVELLREGWQRERRAEEGRLVADEAGREGGDGRAGVDAPVVDLLGRRPVLLEGEEAHCCGLFCGREDGPCCCVVR